MSYYPGNDIRMGTDRITGERVMLSRFDRARHTCMFGSSRTGKSKLIEHMGREDILQWSNDHCPIVVIDPHGTLYKNLMAFVVAENLKEWPIVPVDLSRGDLIVSYNLLRRRAGVDPSIVCRSFVDAILYAWGQANSNQTARLATWLHMLLMLSYEREHTLTEALQIIANPELRRLIAADVQDLVVRTVLESAEQLRERDFQDRVESTMYRINRFLSGQILRATFCQTGESLDMGEVLAKGKILLANLSTEGTHIHSEDASAFGSVMLTDLWNAANRRGKREEGEISPCYVYVDEFQNFVGPTIAKGLAEASGFGLHLTLSNQWPSQIISHGGEVGQLVLDSVLNNAQNKIVFKLEHPDDLDMLTRILFRQSVDANKIKDEIISPTLVGYDLQYLKSFNKSASTGSTDSTEESHSTSHGKTITTSQSTTVGMTETHGTSDGTSDAETVGSSEDEGESESVSNTVGRSRDRGQSDGTSTSDSDSEQWTSAESKGSSIASGTGQTQTETLSFGAQTRDFENDLYYRNKGDFNQEEEDAFRRKWLQGMSQVGGDSTSQVNSTNQGTSSAVGGGKITSRADSHVTSRSDSESKAYGDSTASNRGKGRSKSRQKGRSRSETESVATTESETTGTSEAVSEQETSGTSKGRSLSNSQTTGEGLSPMLKPILENRVSSRQFASVEEQLFSMSQLIDAQRVRQCFLRLASAKSPIPVFTPQIDPPRTTIDWMKKRTTQLIETLPFVLPFARAEQNVRDRQGNLLSTLLNAKSRNEPATSRRRVQARVIKPPSHPD